VRAGWFVLHHDSASATNGRLDESSTVLQHPFGILCGRPVDDPYADTGVRQGKRG